MSPRGALPILVGLCVCLLAISGIAATAAAQQPEQPEQSEQPTPVVEQHGSGVALEDEETTYLWRYSSYSMSVTFSATSDEIHTVCLSQYDEDSVDQPLACQWTAVDTNGSTTVTLTQSEWAEEMSGDETLAIEIYAGRNTNGEPIEQVRQPVHIMEKDNDLDGNGLTNEREIELGTHPAEADSDGDGLTDGIEVMIGTDPRDSATPYRIAIVAIGSLTVGAFGFLLVAGRFMMGLRALGISTGRDSDAEPATEPADQQTFEAPIRDEERIRRLLSSHDGRLKQSQIVEATDWSKSKVSRLLSSMEDDAELTRVRLGRENLVCLRGHEPADVTPSWEDTDGSSTGGASP